MLCFATCNVENKRPLEQFKEAQNKRRIPQAGVCSHLLDGVGTSGCKQALQQLARWLILSVMDPN